MNGRQGDDHELPFNHLQNFLHNKYHIISMNRQKQQHASHIRFLATERANQHDSAEATTRTPTRTITYPIPSSSARSPDTDAPAEVKAKTVENGVVVV